MLVHVPITVVFTGALPLLGVLGVCCFFCFCPSYPLLKGRDGDFKFVHCEGSVTLPWLLFSSC